MKQILAALSIGAILLSNTALAADNAALPRLTLTAEKGTDPNEIVLTVAVKDTAFNAIQFAVDYDETKLTPKSVLDDNPVTDPDSMTDYLAPVYERGQGWMDCEFGAFDTTTGVVEYVLYADPNSSGKKNGSDGDGYVTAGSGGLNLFSLHFTLKDTAVFTADSIELTATDSNSDCVILSAKTADPGAPNVLRGRSLGLRDFTAFGIPLADTAEPEPPVEPELPVEPEQPDQPNGGGGMGGNGGGDIGGSSAGTGGNGAGSTNTGGTGSTDNTSTKTAADMKDITGHWAEQDIIVLAERGILTGYSDGTFRPDDKINRGECCIVLCRTLGLQPMDGDTAFSDLDGVWAKPYINAVHNAGLVGGVGGGRFDAGRSITRQEVFKLIADAFQLPAAEGQTGIFEDNGLLSAWARDGAERAVASGIVQGNGQMLDPTGEISRAEMAAILCRAMKLTQ